MLHGFVGGGAVIDAHHVEVGVVERADEHRLDAFVDQWRQVVTVDLGSDEGMDQCLELLAKLNASKTRLARSSYLDENDIGLSFTRTFLAPNKIDLDDAPLRWDLFQEETPLDFETFIISAKKETGLDPLRQAIFESLDVIRVYTKLPEQ